MQSSNEINFFPQSGQRQCITIEINECIVTLVIRVPTLDVSLPSAHFGLVVLSVLHAARAYKMGCLDQWVLIVVASHHITSYEKHTLLQKDFTL